MYCFRSRVTGDPCIHLTISRRVMIHSQSVNWVAESFWEMSLSLALGTPIAVNLPWTFTESGTIIPTLSPLSEQDGVYQAVMYRIGDLVKQKIAAEQGLNLDELRVTDCYALSDVTFNRTEGVAWFNTYDTSTVYVSIDRDGTSLGSYGNWVRPSLEEVTQWADDIYAGISLTGEVDVGSGGDSSSSVSLEIDDEISIGDLRELPIKYQIVGADVEPDNLLYRPNVLVSEANDVPWMHPGYSDFSEVLIHDPSELVPNRAGSRSFDVSLPAHYVVASPFNVAFEIALSSSKTTLVMPRRWTLR